VCWFAAGDRTCDRSLRAAALLTFRARSVLDPPVEQRLVSAVYEPPTDDSLCPCSTKSCSVAITSACRTAAYRTTAYRTIARGDRGVWWRRRRWCEVVVAAAAAAAAAETAVAVVVVLLACVRLTVVAHLAAPLVASPCLAAGGIYTFGLADDGGLGYAPLPEMHTTVIGGYSRKAQWRPRLVHASWSLLGPNADEGRDDPRRWTDEQLTALLHQVAITPTSTHVIAAPAAPRKR
jgi:hypothetical protein